MSNPENNTQPRNTAQQGRTIPPRKKGNPFGPLIALFLLAGLGFLIFSFFQKRDSGAPINNLNFPKLPSLSSLKLPQPNNSSPQPTPPPALSQNQPFPSAPNNMPPANSNNNSLPPNNPPPPQNNVKRPQYGSAPNPKAIIKTSQKTKRIISSSRVQSGYSNSIAQTFSATAPINKLPIINKTKINASSLVPAKGLIQNSVNSFIAYPEKNPLAVKPSQIITFRTKFFQRELALSHATNRLAQLGFTKIQIPIDDYERGGSTVIEGINDKGEQVYFSFKPFYSGDLTNTAWKLEFY